MTRIFTICFVVFAVMAGISTMTFALDQSEVDALTDFYIANHDGLDLLPFPWSSNIQTACGDVDTPAWSGVGCDAGRTHILTMFVPPLFPCFSQDFTSNHPYLSFLI
jgi:hypothetical protein